jgi:dihydroorotate dehydrogenase (fumarate)
MEEGGAAAAVMPSLFEEQIDHVEPVLRGLPGSAPPAFIESLYYFRELAEYNKGPDVLLRYIEHAKKAVSIPLIGSLNATSIGPWIQYGRRIEAAGADALELNLYLLVTDPDTTSEEVESRYLELVSSVRETISIPLAVKIGPYFSSLPNMARRLAAAGGDGLVLFNRFLQPDVDVDALQTLPHLTLSSADEFRLPLRWIGILHNRGSWVP